MTLVLIGFEDDRQVYVPLTDLPGATTGAAGYNHVQSIAAQVWLINHNLGYRPNIQSFDSSGVEVVGNVIQHSLNAASCVFSVPISGYARCA